MWSTADDEQLLEACQAVGLHLLDQLSCVCAAHNLRFHLGGGTLLGAVRDGRFIPWDDDVDVTMPRHDFEQLRALAHADPKLFGSGCRLDVGVDQIGRLIHCDSDTPDGPLHLDVFVLDPVPSGLVLRYAVTSWFWLLKTIESVTWGTWQPSSRTASVAAVVRMVGRVMGQQRVSLLRERALALSSRLSDGHTWNVLVGTRPFRRSRPAKWYLGDRREWFEGRHLPVPTDAEAILRMMYGPTFMTPPTVRQPPHVRPPLHVSLGARTWRIP